MIRSVFRSMQGQIAERNTCEFIERGSRKSDPVAASSQNDKWFSLFEAVSQVRDICRSHHDVCPSGRRQAGNHGTFCFTLSVLLWLLHHSLPRHVPQQPVGLGGRHGWVSDPNATRVSSGDEVMLEPVPYNRRAKHVRDETRKKHTNAHIHHFHKVCLGEVVLLGNVGVF